jgi:hypothetical protein
MIPLIQCSIRDSNNYYAGVVVVHPRNGVLVPLIFRERTSDNTVLCVEHTTTDGRRVQVPYGELKLHIFPAMYTSTGEWVGLNVRRSTRRGCEYSLSTLPCLQKYLNGESLRDGGRLSASFFVKTFRGISMLHHNGAAVGFREQDTFFVTAPEIRERLQKVLEQEGITDVSVQLV